METKLTLKLEKKIIEKGKAFARKKKTSLSKLIENYLEKVTEDPIGQEISPLVKSLSGTVKNSTVQHKSDYTKFLRNKYK
jgi:hypothetical protein